MNKRANISYKLSQPGVVTCFHKVSISELGNRKTYSPFVGQNSYELSNYPAPQHPFPYLSLTPDQDCEVLCLEG